jgi:uncharacterized heparinase superfamily protein
VQNAPYAGYQRLEVGPSVLLVDTGTPPPLGLNYEAHAGCLAFEFSTGRNRLVVNCGVPSTNRAAWLESARATAAHSTAIFNDTSSCRFFLSPKVSPLIGVPIIAGPKKVEVVRAEREGALLLRASHDGYAERFEIIHQRSWRLAADGSRLDGEDIFLPAFGDTVAPEIPDRFDIRFHLHPSVKATRLADHRAVLLVLPGRESWLFTASNMVVELEESVFLSAPDGPRRTQQMVISGRARQSPRVVWTFIRTEKPQGQARSERPREPQLPL